MLDQKSDSGGVTYPARSLARRHQAREISTHRCARATAPKAMRSRRRSKTIRPEACSAGRSPPPARPDKSTSMSTARWPDASCPRRSFRTAAPLRWREMKCASASPNSPFAWRRDLPPRSSPYTVQQVLDAVDTLHPAIEIPDSRFSDFVSAGAAQIIADNACAHLFVLGAPTTANWRALDLVEEKPVITLRGKQFIGHGKNVLGDPRVALAWLANELRPARRDAARRPDRDHRHLSPAAADPIRRFVRRRFRLARQGIGGI